MAAHGAQSREIRRRRRLLPRPREVSQGAQAHIIPFPERSRGCSMHPRLLVVALAALTLAGCGRGENTSAPAATDPAAATTASDAHDPTDPSTSAPTQENQAMALQKIELKPGTGP